MKSESSPEMQRVEDAMNSLSEHYDTVQIFVTRYEPTIEGGTVNASLGSGNWYARYGQVREWLIKSEENSRQEAACHQDGE